MLCRPASKYSFDNNGSILPAVTCNSVTYAKSQICSTLTISQGTEGERYSFLLLRYLQQPSAFECQVLPSPSPKIVLFSPQWTIQGYHFLTLDVLIQCSAQLKGEYKEICLVFSPYVFGKYTHVCNSVTYEGTSLGHSMVKGFPLSTKQLITGDLIPVFHEGD